MHTKEKKFTLLKAQRKLIQIGLYTQMQNIKLFFKKKSVMLLAKHL
jgi:hypothetical protein